jgi:hypothetical protein
VYGLHRVQGDEEHGFLGLASKLRSTVSPSLASKSMATVLVVWPQNHSLRFPGFDLKTKWAMVYRLCHKTDGRMKTVWGTHRHLTACFTWM